MMWATSLGALMRVQTRVERRCTSNVAPHESTCDHVGPSERTITASVHRDEAKRTEFHGGHRPVPAARPAPVFGINDGLVSNVSLILGFAGSGVDSSIVRLAGLAGAIAGGISMAAGEWISISAQNELVEREVAVERREPAGNAEAETDELAAMYESHGISPDTARVAAEDVMTSPEIALRVHTREEMGIDPHELPSAFQAAAISFVCFMFGALLPVIPWFTGARRIRPGRGLRCDRRRRGPVRRCCDRSIRGTVDTDVHRSADRPSCSWRALSPTASASSSVSMSE